jgi:hypothetical protein
MSAKIVSVTKGEGGSVTYDVDAAGVRLAIEFYPGDREAGELEWHAGITFVSEEVIIGGGGANRHAAFMAAASREDVVAHQSPLPTVAWSDVDQTLREAGAF